MNKIFKVIFNKTTGQFVVVSELSKAKGKASSSTDERVGVSSLVTKLQHQAKAALILGLLGVSSVAYAAEPTYGSNDGTGSPIAIGDGSNASGEANIALGEQSSATDTSRAKKQMIAIGSKASVTGSQAIAIGGDTVASGFGSIAIGGDDMDGLPEYKELRYNPTSGKVQNRGNESAYQKTTASGVGSISIGPKSQSLQNGTVAVGVLATAAGTESVSIGVKSASKGASSVALGAGSTASADNSVAIGNKAVAELDGGVALGKDSIANIAAGRKGYNVLTNSETTLSTSVWQATHAAVAVGEKDATVTRQIVGVAAGTNGSDAVNVAQLQLVAEKTKDNANRLGSVETNINNINNQITTANIKFAGNTGETPQMLNSTLNIKGADNSGIKTTASSNNVTIDFDQNLKTKLSNLADNPNATYANKTDVDNINSRLNQIGTGNLTFGADSGTATGKRLGDTLNINGENGISTRVDGGNIKIGLDTATKAKLDNLPSADQIATKNDITNLNTQLGLPANNTGGLGIPSVQGSDNSSSSPTTVVGAVKDVVNAVNKGISIQGNDSSAINKKLGQTFDIVGTHSGNEVSSSNIKTRKTTDGKLEIVMAEKPEFKQVSAGEGSAKTIIGKDGVEVKKADGSTAAKLGENLDLQGTGKVTGLKNGDVNANSTDAVTGSQLFNLEKLMGVRDENGNMKPDFGQPTIILNDGTQGTSTINLQDQINSISSNMNKGLIFHGDSDEINSLSTGKSPKEQYLGSQFSVMSAADGVSLTKNNNTASYVGKNLVTKYTKDKNGNGIVAVAMSETPEFKEVAVKGTDPSKSMTLSPTGTVVKDGDKQATYGADGITLKDGNGETKLGRDNDGNLTVKNGDKAPVALATKDQLDSAGKMIGDGKDGNDGKDYTDPTSQAAQGPTGKDGLNGKDLTDKVNALRNGEAGSTVYTDAEGNRLVKGNDGKYYNKDQDGNPTGEAVKAPIASVVNPDGSVTTPTTMGNVKSTIGLNGKDGNANQGPIVADVAQKAIAGDAKDGKGGLLNKSGPELNNAATVGDLQALAQAGLDFTGNDNTETVHRPLGTKLTVVGERDDNKTSYSANESAKNNLIVEANATTNTLTVKMANELKNLKSIEASDSIKVGTDENGVKITPTATTTTKTEGTGADKKVTTVTAGAEGTSIVQKDANDQPLKSAEYKLDGSKVDDGKGNTTEVKAGGLTAKDADSTTKVDANGMDVKSDDSNDKSAATYGKDGLTVKGNDGKDAISLTSTTAGGKTTNTLALNGKDGKDAVSITSGADGAAPEISFAKNGEDGTGSITGLKDVERNPDGTAKDKTQAANAGYVDDRLKEMNEGKPFEYFEKDPVTGEVKTETVDGKQVPVTLVRGKDGKFYKESDLKGKVFDPATNTYKNADGTPATLTEVASNNVTVQAMPSPTGKPLEMGNVGSGLGLDDSTTNNATALTPEQAQTAIAGSGKDGKGGLLTKTGSSLNNVATVKDLQALAQAGLDFVGNETTTTAVHRPLGTKLVVQGETDTANQTLAQFGATAKDNIYVDTDATNNKLVVKMTEDLKNIGSLTTKPVDNPDGTKTSTKLTSTGTVVSKVDPAKLDANGKPTPVETANYGLTTELKKTDADGKVTTSTSAPTGTTLSEADKNGNKLREAEYDLDGTKVTLKDPVTGATKEISTGVDGTKVTSKDPATGVTKETTIGVDGTTVKVTDKNNPNNNKLAEYGVDGTALKAKDAQGNDISADYKVGGATVKDKDNTTEIKPDGMTVKSTDEADKSEAKYGKDGLSIVGPKGKDGKDGISLGYKPDTDANGQPTGTSTPTLEFGKGEKDPDGNDKGTGSITGLKDVERNPDGTAKDRTAAANAGYVDERLAEANATKPLGYFGTDGKKLVLGQDGKFYKPEDLEGKVYVKRKDGTEGYFNSEEKDNPTAKSVDLKNKAVDPQTVTIKAMPSDASNTPITMSNVGSGLGLKDDAESNKTALTPADAQKAIAGDNKDGKGGLLVQTGEALNNVATVKDLQALAQAGLDFTGNNTATTVHRPLGTKLTVEGEGKWNGKDSAANNLYVEAQEADNKLVVKMNKDLTNLNSVTLGTATMTGDKNTINLTGAGEKVEEEFVKWDPVTKQPIRDKDGNLQKYKEKVDPRVKLSGIADGDISPNSTDAVNGRQVYALTNGNQVEQKKDGSTVTYAKDKDGSVITEVKRDKNGNPELDADGKEIVQPKEYKLTTYNVSEQQEFVTNSVITAVHNMNEQGIKFFHTNDGHNAEKQINQESNTVDSSASGTYATAVGYKAVAVGDNALAMGKGATASGKNSIAIGTGNQVIANKSGAFGDPNIIRGVQIGTDSAGNPIYKGIDGSYAFGNDNVITSSNTFVLGNNVNNKRDSNGALTWMSAIPEGTVENSVYLGNNTTATAGDGSQTGSLKNWKQDGSRGSTTTAGSTGTVSSATVGNMIYGGFAGATANGVVSVGAAGDERRIQNVAAGEISSTSTDAINGSQLYNVAHRLGAKLESEGRQLRAGIAATTAMSNIPQVTLPGKSTLGAGIGTFEGQNAIAVGFSRMSDNGRVILKVSAGATSQGKYNAGAGIALQW
ncbi:YadA-like family protein [Glaesserella parasuis]|nr:YadA-like family protein [Glaesserella parasuis]MDO9833540.1 YadA-like family protein [Glaesserella parasuis]